MHPPLLFRPKAAGSAVRINLLVFHKILNEKLDLDASFYFFQLVRPGSKPYAEFQGYDKPQVNQQPSFQAKIHAVFLELDKAIRSWHCRYSTQANDFEGILKDLVCFIALR